MKLDVVLEAALEWTLKHEGGFANDPLDRGGATNWGITLGVLKGLGRAADFDGDGDVDAQDVVLLTREEAKEIYRKKYWPWSTYGSVMPELVERLDPRVLMKHFDIGVNMGRRAADLLLQRAVNLVRGQLLVEDAVVGVRTLSAAGGCNANDLLRGLVEVQLDRYDAIVEARPDQAKWLPIWRKRARAIPEAPRA